MSLPGVGPVGLQPNQGLQGQTNNAEIAKEAIKEALQTIDTEIMALSGKKDLGIKEPENRTLTLPKETQQAAGLPNELLQKAAEQAAAALAKERIEEEKEARKNDSLDETMENLSHLEGKIDESNVPEEQKGIVRQFFDNMSRIKQLRTKLKQLEEKEKMIDEQLRREEDEKERKKREEEQVKKREKGNNG